MWGRLYERQLTPTYSLLTFNSLKEKFPSPTNPYPNSNGSYPPLPTHTAKGHSHQSLPHPRGSAPSIPAPKRSFPPVTIPHLTGSSSPPIPTPRSGPSPPVSPPQEGHHVVSHRSRGFLFILCKWHFSAYDTRENLIQKIKNVFLATVIIRSKPLGLISTRHFEN